MSHPREDEMPIPTPRGTTTIRRDRHGLFSLVRVEVWGEASTTTCRPGREREVAEREKQQLAHLPAIKSP